MAYFSLLFFIIGGFFRRILGKQLIIKGIKISRFYKLVVLVLLCLSMYYIKGIFPKTLMTWLCMLWAIGWYVRYWDHTHGDYWILDSESPDEGRSWWVDKVLQLFFGKGKYYNFNGNFVGLTLGYLAPALLGSFSMSSHWFWLAGFTTPLGYLFCESCLKFTKRETEYAEILNGSVSFLLFFLTI